MFNFLLLSHGALAFLQNIAAKFSITMSRVPGHTRDLFWGDISLSFSVCLNYQTVMMSTSAALMKNVFHALSKLDFDTTLVNYSHCTCCSSLYCVYHFRNIVAIDLVPSSVGINS